MNRASVLALRVLLSAMILLLVIAQVFALPATASAWAAAYPDLAWLRIPALAVAVGFIVCVQVVLACLWRMLGFAEDDGPFSARSLSYITVIIVMIAIADALIAVALVLLAAANAANPSIMLLGLFGIVVGAGLAVLVGVLRELLRQALQLQHDLSEVV
jgi:hypothetical protein